MAAMTKKAEGAGSGVAPAPAAAAVAMSAAAAAGLGPRPTALVRASSRPASPSPSASSPSSLVLRSEAGHQQRRPPKRVMEEDAYTDALAAIIERDFFPHLARLRAQEEYLEVRPREPREGGDAMDGRAWARSARVWGVKRACWGR